MKILALGASNNPSSINQALAAYTANQVPGADVEVLAIDDYELPIFSEEREEKFGQPLQARRFLDKIADADGLIVSFAEHNGSYTAAFKNLYDWASRVKIRVFQDKPTVFLATSPGPDGAQRVLEAAVASAPFSGARLIGHLSVPRFQENFDSVRAQPVNVLQRKQLQQLARALGQEINRDARMGALAATAGYPYK